MALPRFEWAIRMAERNRAAVGLTDEPDVGFETVKDFAEEMLGDLAPTTGLEWISTCRQFARISHNGDESAIFFDLSQAKALRRLCALLDPMQDSMNFLNALKETVVLSLCDDEPRRAQALKGIDYEDRRWLDAEPQSLGPALQHFAEIARAAQAPDIVDLLDCCLVAHEVQHLIHRRDRRGGVADEAAEAAFERALPLVYYQSAPDFESRVTHGGLLKMDRQGIERIRTDLVEREAHARASRAALVDEIACDLFAYYCFEYCLNRARGTEEVFLAADCFMLWFMLHDLHRAMIDRAEIAPRIAAGDPRPPSIADMGFRRTALLCGIHELALWRVGPDQPDVAEMIWERLVEGAEAAKKSFDLLYHRPIVRIMLHQLDLAAAESVDNEPTLEEIVDPTIAFG